MGLENKSGIPPEIPPSALLGQARIPFGQRMINEVFDTVGRYTPHSWRLLLAAAFVSGGLNLARVEAASADTPNNPSTFTELFKTATTLTEAQKQQIPADFDVNQGKGHFFTQTRGDAEFPKGFLIEGNFWAASQKLGGVSLLGYPIAQSLVIDGIKYQPLQKGLLQENPQLGVVLANIMDMAHQKGLDDWLYAQGIPHHLDFNDGSQGDFNKAAEVRLKELMTDPMISAKFFENPNPKDIAPELWNPFQFFGLPTSKPEKIGPIIAQRFQRGVIIRWVEQVPNGQPLGTIQFANVPDLLKQLGLYGQAAIPIDNPYGTGGGNGSGSVNGTEIFSPELPFPAEVGNLAVNRVVFYNKGKVIGVKLNSAEVFEYDYSNPAKKYFPQGVEFFLYDMEKEEFRTKVYLPIYNNLNYEIKPGGGLAPWSSYNTDYESNLYLASVNKNTGRLEIHVGLPRKKAIPTPTDPNRPKQDMTHVVSDQLGVFMIWAAGGPFNNDPEDIGWLNNPYSRQGIFAFNLVE